MRGTTAKPSLPADSTPSGSLATDLVDLAKADADVYQRRRESARHAVSVTGADSVLAELRDRLNAALDVIDPAVGAVALASTIATLTT